MAINLIVRRKNLNIFLQTREDETLLTLKKEIHGILQINPTDQKLYFKRSDTVKSQPDAYSAITLTDTATLKECGYNGNMTEFENFSEMGLATRGKDGEFEELVIQPLSQPPELPDCMKPVEVKVEPKK